MISNEFERIDMKKTTLLIGFCMSLFVVFGCKDGKNTQGSGSDSDSLEGKRVSADSTLYGVCGEETAMHTLQLITDQGDTLSFLIDADNEERVLGGLLAGDRMAVMPGKMIDGERMAETVINLTTLIGKWTSLDKNFEIQEGGDVKSHIEAEANPWTMWKICNGKLLLNKDTFAINKLGADSLYLENEKGIFAFKRQR